MTRCVLRLMMGVCAIGLAIVTPARAQRFDLPGIAGDSAKFQTALQAPYPTGGTPSGRSQTENRAATAAQRNDWTAAATALEARLGQRSTNPDLWLLLAQAELKRTPPDPTKAVQAAYLGFNASSDTDQQAGLLALAAQALMAQNRPAQASTLLQSAVKAAPDNTDYPKLLIAANRAAGLVVQRVTTSEDTDPPRACILFNVSPSRRNDFHPEDWVRLTPPVVDASITREGGSICVSGLPLAATTTATLRAGLPAEDGISLSKDTPVGLTLGNRSPTLVFNNRLFILPRGQTPRIVLTSANVSSVKVSVGLLTERTMLPWARDNDLGTALSSYIATNVDTDHMRVVWTGRAEITGFSSNVLMHTVLPLPADAMRLPGLYAVSVTSDDGQPDSASAIQPVLQTDLAPTVWRGTDGLTVQIRSYADAKPRAGVTLRLMAQNNDILTQAVTDADGMARFPAPLLHGAGVMAATAIQGMAEPAPGSDAGRDFVSLNLDATAFDLSDRGVSGAPQPGPLDAYVWTDRGIYRPGETIQLMALLRDNGGQPVERPAHLRVVRPNGETFQDVVAPPGGGGSLHAAITLSNGAAVGVWTAQLLADPKQSPLAEMSFTVDAFVPDRMAVTLAGLPPQLAPGQTAPVQVSARFLYGAPAANLTGSANIHVGFAPQPPAALAGFLVGLTDEAFAPAATSVDLPPTDDQGHSTLPLRLGAIPDSTHPLQAALDVEVDDPSGHATHVAATVPVRPATDLIGIKRLFDGSVDAGSEAGFDIAAIDPDGKRVALPMTLRLVRERPDWRLVKDGNTSSYQIVWRDEPQETHELTIPADGLLHFARKLGFGRYRMEVAQKNGLAASSVRFRSGWASSDSPDVPDRADVSADRQSYAPGATARVHVAAPFAGPATLLVMTDRVQSVRQVDVPEAGADFDVPVDPVWGPGAYVAIHVFRGGAVAGGDARRPDRAIGLVWLGIDPAARRLPLSIEVPDLVRPRQTAHAVVHTSPGAWVSIAAVDEGILHLTNFQTPDPGPHFLGRRALGVDIRDDWGRLIAPADGTATLLRQGGDEDVGRRPNIPITIVSLFQAPVQADAQGRVDVPLPYPDFNGQVRLMAVAWDGNRMASAAQDMLVRDQLIAEPLLPRFLAPGDTGRLAILLQNLDLPTGPIGVKISTDGPLSLQGDPTIAMTLAQGAQTTPNLMLHADGAGIGHVRLDVTGPDGFHAMHEVALDVHSPRSRDSVVLAGELGPDATAALAPPVANFIGGTWKASAMFGSPVRYDVRALVRALDDYPLFCLEQASSKGLPLALLTDEQAGADRGARLQQMVNAVLDRQRFDGGFGLWSAGDDAEPWLSVYATEFLLRARRAGATVGEGGVNDAIKWVADQIATTADGPSAYAAQAYRLYVLALAGQPRAGANRVLFESLDQLPSPLAKAQLAAALALGNDRPRALRAFAAALDAPAPTPWAFDYGTAMRDQAAMGVLLKESGLLPDRLSALIAKLPGADTKPQALSTQEQAWLAAAGGALGRDGAITRVSLDGRALAPAPVVTVALDGAATARNTGDRAVWQTVSVSGVLATPPAASRSGMRITRQFMAQDGSPLDLTHLRQNTVFVLLLEGRADDGQGHHTQLIQGLPAGWEIAGRLAAGDVAGMPWLGKLTDTVAMPAADDRFQAVLELTAEQPAFRIAVRLRAVTPGNFDIPGAELSDMYRPGIYARQGDNRIDVLPPQ